MTERSTTSVPVLPVSDLVRSLAWYERLGFDVRAGYPGYAILALDGAEVHLVETHDLPPAAGSFSGAYLRVEDVDAVHARWTALGAPPLAGPADRDHGQREFATEDPDGNLWRVGSPLPVTDVAIAPDPAEATEAAPRSSAPTDGGIGTDDGAWFPLVAGGVRCAGCGLDPSERPARALGAEVRDVVHAFGEVLAAADDQAVRLRPEAQRWSALEYGVHVRDLLTVFAERIIRTLAEDEPELGWWDHEAAIEDGLANESDVAAVVDDLGRNAAKLSESLRLVDDDAWDRTAIRRGTERFTIELMARFALHEVVHHRVDAEWALEAAGTR